MLIINHHFDQDIEALLTSCADAFQFLIADCMPLFGEALLHFESMAEQDGIVPYGDLDVNALLAYRRVCGRLFADLQRIFPFDLIMMPSDSFWWIREFLMVAGERGVPRVVLDKEGTISPYSYHVHAAQIRTKFPFISDELLVWSERQRQFWIRAGAPEGRIAIVGQPRSDFFFNRARWISKGALGLEAARRMVLFFTFDVDAYINIYPAEEVQREGLTWEPLRDEAHQVLVAFARTHPDLDIVVKAHPQQADIAAVREAFAGAKLGNIKVMDGAGISNHLIVNADLIVGFQTTALIEAMLTDKPVIYTQWGPTEAKLRHDLIPFDACDGLEHARSAEHLVQLLEAWSAGRPIRGAPAARRKFTDEYLHADGMVANRLKQALMRIYEASDRGAAG